ncbi:MAG: hypothetical protein PW792_16955 [Acidobacteriaceae bacterium]|nr:hypothetical protein [Acidobacteriaceae bacterium]
MGFVADAGAEAPLQEACADGGLKATSTPGGTTAEAHSVGRWRSLSLVEADLFEGI